MTVADLTLLADDQIMLGLMQDVPLTIESILNRGEQYFGKRQITTRLATGLERITVTELGARARQIADVLDRLGVSAGGRVGSFGWNSANHLALYYGVPCTGRVLHTINIRMFADQIRYSVNHAEDELIFCDQSLLALLVPNLPYLETVKHVVVFDDSGGAGSTYPAHQDPRIVAWAELAGEQADFCGRVSDERTAAALCYTTGTTGNPKGVLYSHRSTWLHAMGLQLSTTFGLMEADRVMPVVPMFHAMAWGMPYGAVMAGSGLVLPGPDLTPTGLLDLMESERVTLTAGVPTIWMGMRPLLAGRDLSALRTVICGGSAVPRALSEAWRETIGVPITQAWGMTELSPMGSVSVLRSEFDTASEAERADVRATAGYAPVGVEMRIMDAATGTELPWDDKSEGELECRGPWVAAQYYGSDEPGEQFSADGWLRTGDIAAISELGYLRLVDRTKDMIKSGGEWISSVALENEIMSHPAIAEAAVIAIPDPRWMERPFACVVLRADQQLTEAELLDFLTGRVAKWSLPSGVAFLAEIPKTSVGKFSKRALRDQFAR
jgi:fatty-acyl-CoA synthase